MSTSCLAKGGSPSRATRTISTPCGATTAPLKGVDYRYGKLDEELPLATLEAGAYQDIRYEGDVQTIRNNCEWY